MTKIIAVVVTHNRPDSLVESVKILAAQTLRLENIIVVDNAADPNIKTLLDTIDFPITYLPSQANLGGGGGFAYGILTALALGAQWVWLADDDGKPESENSLQRLYELAVKYSLGEISPLVVDNSNPNLLAFPLRQGLVWHRTRSKIVPENGEILFGIASLFNGALFKSETFLDIGVPDLRYFIRGDEVEIHRRLVRSAIPFGTTPLTAYLHPNGSAEFHPIMSGKAHAQYPDNEIKRFYTYRNRGLLLAQPGMTRMRLQEFIRFSWFFLFTQHDIKGFTTWCKLYKLGKSERFNRNFTARQSEEYTV